MAGLSDLSFDPGINFSKLVSQCFKCSVSPLTRSSKTSFSLIVTFGRSALRLNEDSVALILQASLGGSAANFDVQHLSGWMFRFLVSCKEVGFMVYKLRSVICKCYVAYFFLWGNGGANWRREHALWCLEQEAEWTLVGSKSKSKKSYADAVRSPAGLDHRKHKIPARKSPFVRLEYPMDYHLNYLSPSFPAHPNPKLAVPPVDPRWQRVLRWLPRIQNSNGSESGAKHQAKSVPRQPKPIPAPSGPSDSSKAVNVGLTDPVLQYCANCLGPGHLRKECTNMVR